MKIVNLSLLFTAKQLIKHYMHIGANYKNVNRSNSYFVLGLYKSISIINLSRILPVLKKKFFFFFKFMLKKFSKVLLISGIHIDYASNIINELEFLSIDYYFGRWWSGYIRNYKVFVKAYRPRVRNMKILKFPRYIFHVPLADIIDDTSGYAASKEFESVGVHSLVFFDSHKNINYINAGVMVNTKTSLNNFFLLHTILSVYYKVYFLKKKNFLIKAVDFLLGDLHTFFGLKKSDIDAQNKKFYMQYFKFLQKKKIYKNFFYRNKNFFKTWRDFLE